MALLTAQQIASCSIPTYFKMLLTMTDDCSSRMMTEDIFI